MKRWTPVAGALSVSVVLAGCAAIPAQRDVGMAALLQSRSDVAASLSPHDGDAMQREVATILAEPMNADAAVRVALLQSPRMRMLYAQLGFAQADIYDASRLSNPSVGYLRMSAEDGATRTTWSLSQSFTELLFLSYRKRVGRSELLQAQQTVASEILLLEADVRSAYYNYVSAALVAKMRERVTVLANASTQYAQQLFDAGNITALQLIREQAVSSEARIEQRRAATTAATALGRLMNLLGLPLQATFGAAQFVVMLPLPVPIDVNPNSLQDWALMQRLDLQALRDQVSMQDINLTHVRRWRWLGGVQGVAERERDAGQTFNGFGAELALPLFNQGTGNLLRAQTSVESAKARLTGLETEIGNDMHARYDALQAAQVIVEEYRQRLVPLRERIVALSQEQQNFMLIGAFELLTAKQQEMDTYQGYLEAVRDYWLAHTELRRAAGGKLPADIEASDIGIAVGIDAQVSGDNNNNALTQPVESIDHSDHDHANMNRNSGETP